MGPDFRQDDSVDADYAAPIRLTLATLPRSDRASHQYGSS